MASLARIAWRIGQVLLPEDFQALEDALAEEARSFAEVAGLPSYGWFALAWDEPELARGTLRVESARAALPGGRIVQSGDNLSLPEPLSLKRAGSRQVDVFLQVLSPEPVSDEPKTRKGPAERALLRSRLSFEEAAPRGRSLFVGRFETKDGRVFQVSRDTVPPLLRLRGTPHLHDSLLVLRDRLVRYDDDLAKHVAEARRSVGPAQTFQRCRGEARKARAILDDVLLDQESPAWARLHPFTVFSALRELLVEICLVEGELPPGPLSRYDHDDLGGVFGSVVRAIEERIDKLPPAVPTLPFREEEGRFIVTDIPQHVLEAQELYLLIERPAAYGELPLDRYNVRLGEPGRLPWISQYSTFGIRPVRASSVPADFGPRFDVYTLPRPGRSPEEKEEWAHVKRARAMGFLRHKEMSGIRAALYWVGPQTSQAQGGSTEEQRSTLPPQAAR